MYHQEFLQMSFENLIPCCRIQDMKTGRLMKNRCARPSVNFLELIRSEIPQGSQGYNDYQRNVTIGKRF